MEVLTGMIFVDVQCQQPAVTRAQLGSGGGPAAERQPSPAGPWPATAAPSRRHQGDYLLHNPGSALQWWSVQQCFACPDMRSAFSSVVRCSNLLHRLRRRCTVTGSRHGGRKMGTSCRRISTRTQQLGSPTSASGLAATARHIPTPSSRHSTIRGKTTWIWIICRHRGAR